MNFSIPPMTSYRAGTNQYQIRHKFLKKNSWISIIIVIAIAFILVAVCVVIGEYEKKLISLGESALVRKVWAAQKSVFIMPQLAPQPERERNEKLIRWIFGRDAQQAIKVFTCESGLRSEAMNTHNSDGFPDVGIAQIHVTNSMPFSVDEMKNPIANLYQAKRLFDTRGWQPWDSSKSCWGK